MNFYTGQHKHYCGIDLHARTMYVCIMDREGEVLVHRNLKTSEQALLNVIEPYREDICVTVECVFSWYWLADLAACLFLRGNKRGQKYHDRLVSRHGKGKALAILSHKLARSVYYMLKRREPFNMETFMSQA